jgi:hypothetical protein
MPCGEVGPRPDPTRSADVDEPGGTAIRPGDHRLWPAASHRAQSSARRCAEENGGLVPRPQSISVRDGRRTPSSAAVSSGSSAIDGSPCSTLGSTCHVAVCRRDRRASRPARADLGRRGVLRSRVLSLRGAVRAAFRSDVPRGGTGDDRSGRTAPQARRRLDPPKMSDPSRTGPARPAAGLSARWCGC